MTERQYHQHMVRAATVGRAIVECCRYVDENKVRVLTDEESRLFMALMLIEDGRAEKKIDKPEEQILCELAPGHILHNRCEQHGVKASFAAKMYLASLADRAGTVVLYAALLHHLHQKKGDEVKLVDVVHAMPWGPPVAAEFSRLWESQKREPGPGHSDNWLDAPEAWLTASEEVST